MFADSAKIIIKSGKGGNGHVSFRREKYVPDGGPDGGDGGKGGDIIFEVDDSMNTLNDFRHKHKWAAENGEEGKKRNCHGKKGEDLVIHVPAGTIIRDATTDKVIADMSGENKRQIILTGGKGGLGNQHFATSSMQAPKYAQPGQEALELEVRLELKVIADVGLVGFPNVGKSTLLSSSTNATPKIANYHFTTLNPILGVVDLGEGAGFVMADIPGLIEGAHEGIGLGDRFLKHIERCEVFLHLIDITSEDVVKAYRDIRKELELYDRGLVQKPEVVALNKCDALPEEETAAKVRELETAIGKKVYPISAIAKKGVFDCLLDVNHYIKRERRQESEEDEQAAMPEKSSWSPL